MVLLLLLLPLLLLLRRRLLPGGTAASSSTGAAVWLQREGERERAFVCERERQEMDSHTARAAATQLKRLGVALVLLAVVVVM